MTKTWTRREGNMDAARTTNTIYRETRGAVRPKHRRVSRHLSGNRMQPIWTPAVPVGPAARWLSAHR